MSTEGHKTKHTQRTLHDSFVNGIKGIFKINDFLDNPFNPFLFQVALVVWLVFVCVVLCLEIPLHDLIIEIKSNMINILPDILGFTIGGYSFLIGFIQPTMMAKISEPRKNSVFSLFQVASASFASNILLHAFSLAIAFMIHFIIWIDDKTHIGKSLVRPINFSLNLIGFLLIAFSFLISIAVIMQLIVNVFNFSQLHHYHVNKEKIDAIKNKVN